MRPFPDSRGSLCASLLVAAALLLRFGFIASTQAPTVLDTNYYHLGDRTNNWPGVSPHPAGMILALDFEVSPPVEGTLRLKQRDVHGVWRIRVNGGEIAHLDRVAAERTSHYSVPVSALRHGRNHLEIIPDNATDDIAVGLFEWIPTPLRTLLDLLPVDVSVLDVAGRRPVPARLSVVTDGATNTLADLYFAASERTAVRPGILYTSGRTNRFELPRGIYRLAATRGMEWSRPEQTLDLRQGSPAPVTLRLRREVDTRGYVAADTHLHTFTFSSHGNATVEERLLSLAGEGVELAVATDHNHQTDYAPLQRQLALNEYFTPVTGNEVTTDNGHFNAFPLDPQASVPPHHESDWVKIIAGIRSHGAKVVILNHPRWPDAIRNPFTRAGLNRASGDRATRSEYTFDAMELVNSTALQKDPLYLFVDWFALLNRGERIKAVGASDTHTVDHPPGQGRTYVASDTDIPSRIDVDAACRHFIAGRATVSLGIFADVRVNGRHRMGDLAPGHRRGIEASLRVAAPSWITPRRALAFLNGVRVAELVVPHRAGVATDAYLTFNLPSRADDAYLVFVVLGDGVKVPGWKTYENYTLAATNPVFLDGDGDRKYTSLRALAERRLPPDFPAAGLTSLFTALDTAEAALGVQLAGLAWAQLTEQPVLTAQLREKVEALSQRREPYALFLQHLPATGVKP